MDPNACLRDAVDALSENRLADASASLHAYRAWRKRGGFFAAVLLLAAVERSSEFARLSPAMRDFVRCDYIAACAAFSA